MALLVFGTLWGMLLLRPDRELPDYLKDLLFIILGHYFAVRGPGRRGRGAGAAALVSAPRVGAAPPDRRVRGDRRSCSIGREDSWRSSVIPGWSRCSSWAASCSAWSCARSRRWWTAGRLDLAVHRGPARATISLAGGDRGWSLIVWDQLLPFLPRTHAGAIHEWRLGVGRIGPPHVLAAIVGFYFGSRS